MTNGAQLEQQDDELDFRPLARQPAPQAHPAAVSDGIDFQPATTPTSKTPQPASQSPDEIDFRPAEKPATFESVYGAPGLGASTLTEQASRLGAPSPDVSSFAPKTFDLTAVPRSPFTNQLSIGTPIATEEEKQRQGTIGAREQTFGERAERALGAGAPIGSKMAEWTGQPGTKDNMRLFAPEQLMTESEQARHPILTGAGEFGGGFTSPEGIMLLAGTAGAGTLAGPAGQTVKQLLAAGFTASMLASAAQQVPEVARAIQTGDSYNAQRLLTHLALTTATAGLAGRGMFEEPKPLTVPKGTISGKLAIDETSVRAARRFRDFETNSAAREGMGRLTEAERGIEAARQARIAAPVEPLKTYEGPPPILAGRPLGPERNPLEVEAAQARELARPVTPGEIDFQPLPEPQPINPQEVEDMSRLLGRQVSAEELPEIRRRLDAERNISEGLRGNLRDEAGEIREAYRDKLERGAVPFSQSTRQELPGGGARVTGAPGAAEEIFALEKKLVDSGKLTQEEIPLLRRAVMDERERHGTPGLHEDTYRALLRRVTSTEAERVLPGMETAVREQREAAGREQGRKLTEEVNRPRGDIEETAGRMERESPLFRGTEASLQREIFAEKPTGEKPTAQPLSNRAKATRVRGAKGPSNDEILAEAYRPGNVVRGYGYGTYDKVLEYIPPDEQGRWSVKVIASDKEGNPLPGERERTHSTPPERADAIAARQRLEVAKVTPQREELGAGGAGTAELYSGVHPKALIESAQVLSRAWDEHVAKPFIDRVAKIGDKYQKAREADPAVAEGLHLLDNAPQYLRSKAAQEVHNVIGDLSRPQERLFTLMADADSRENLRVNHPREYAEAQRDPAIQEALRKYKPLEQELTGLREKMGGENLDQDYLRRVYDKYIAGVNKPSAEGKPPETGQFDRVIRPQNVNPKSREASAEYHYQNGLHELGPAFGTKFVATHLKALRDEVAQGFLSKATLLKAGGEEPRSITYGGERYFRPDVAREMRDAGAKGAKEYGSYDPTQGEKFPVPAEGRYLGPKEITKTLTDYGRKEEGDPGALRRFFQEQIIGFGFGVPHIANIMRRVSQSVPGGALNPKGWLDAWRIGLSKELRDRGIAGLNDPTFDMLARHGAISTGELANLKEYWGGNFNPANWARELAQVGHKVLFEPGAAGGFGGIDQRARLYMADLMKSQRPELSDAQISEAVRTQLGDYNRANWSDRQKLLGRFMMFPGWDFSSVRWVLEHPVKTTVPPALMVMLANRALHSFGLNREEDKYDIGAVHVGDRAYSATLLRESMARNLFRPVLNYAQAKIRGENNARAMDEAARGLTSGAGGLLGMVRPDLSGFVALAANRQNITSSKEVFSRQDRNTPGKILPSKELENVAVFAVRHTLPQLDRMLDSNEDIDLRTFAGGNLGLPNYRDDAEKRLIRDTAEAGRVYQQVGKLAKTNPEQARQFLKDPDNATYALFYRDFASMTKMLNRIDQAKEAVEGGKLSDAEKQSRLQTIEKARTNVLAHADGMSRLLFERREKARSFSLPGLLPGLFGNQPNSPRIATPEVRP